MTTEFILNGMNYKEYKEQAPFRKKIKEQINLLKFKELAELINETITLEEDIYEDNDKPYNNEANLEFMLTRIAKILKYNKNKKNLIKIEEQGGILAELVADVNKLLFSTMKVIIQ